MSGWILSTRIIFTLAKAGRCSLRSTATGKSLDLNLGPFSQGKQGLFYLARFLRQLKYIQKILDIGLNLAAEWVKGESAIAEIVFRGITEGEFVIRNEEFELPISPSEVDLTKP
jgi:hypothetical protein